MTLKRYILPIKHTLFGEILSLDIRHLAPLLSVGLKDALLILTSHMVSLRLRLDNTSQGCIARLPFFSNIKYGNYNIYLKLISLNSQIKVIFNDIKHFVVAKQKNLY